MTSNFFSLLFLDKATNINIKDITGFVYVFNFFCEFLNEVLKMDLITNARTHKTYLTFKIHFPDKRGKNSKTFFRYKNLNLVVKTFPSELSSYQAEKTYIVR